MLEEVPLAGGQPEQLGKLADGDDQRQAEDEARDHRLGEEVRDEPEPDDPGQEQDHADDEREGRGECRVSAGSPAAMMTTTAADITAMVELAVTLSCRLVPKMA